MSAARCARTAAMAVVLLWPAACGGQPAPIPTGSTIVVGAAVSLTGSLQDEGRSTSRGYQMWLDWVAARGGIVVGRVRHPVRLVLRDDRSRPELAAQLARELVSEEEAQFLLGPYGSAATATVAAVAEQARIPLVEGNGAALATFEQGYRYVFGVLSPSDRYMAGVLDMAAGLDPRPRTIALVSADDSFSLEVARSVEASAPVRGFEIVASERYPAGSTDLTPYLALAARMRPDVLINSGHFEEALTIHRGAKRLALDAKIFAYSVGPSTPDFVPQLGPDADYVFSGSQWTPQVRYRPQMYLTVPEYRAAYKRMFRTLDEPSYHVADATAAALALQRALETAGTLRPDRVRDALAALDVMTFYGRIKFDRRGVNVFKPMVVEQIQHGRHHTVYPADVADARPSYPTPPWSLR